MKKRLNKFLSCILAICMMVSSVPVYALGGSDVGGSGSSATPNVTRVADKSTVNSYQDALPESTGRYAGRVWSDKSVFANDGNGTNTIKLDEKSNFTVGANNGDGFEISFDDDFLHVFSALGSSQTEIVYPESPIDLVLILDLSQSMLDVIPDKNGHIYSLYYSDIHGDYVKDDSVEGGYRLYDAAKDGADYVKVQRYSINSFSKTINDDGSISDPIFTNTRLFKLMESANDTITKLMEQNEQNRVSVVVYDRAATVIMPLAHYEPSEYILHSELVDTPYDQYFPYLSPIEYWDYPEDPKVEYICPKVMAVAKPEFQPEDWSSNYDGRNGTKWAQIKNHYSENAVDMSESLGIRVTYQYDAIYGTNPNAGLTAALQELADEKVTTYTEQLFNDSYSTVPRIPAVIFMTDGGANTVSQGGWVNPDFKQESLANQRENEWSSVTILQTLMAAAYLKSAVEKNYSNYTNSGAGQSLGIYSVGVDLREESEPWTQPRLFAIMDPANYFKADVTDQVETPEAELGTGVITTGSKWIRDAYSKWESWKAGEETNITFPLTRNSKNEFITIQNPYDINNCVVPFAPEGFNLIWTGFYGGTEGSSYDADWANRDATAEFKDFDEATKGSKYVEPTRIQGSYQDKDNQTQNHVVNAVTKQDMINNINYVTEFYNVESFDIGKTFNDILNIIINKAYIPVGGKNEAGVSDAMTYTDPVGKYMEVKDVTDLLLFGTDYKVVKTGVYDPNFALTSGEGWYSADGEYLGSASEGNWDDGDTYYLSRNTIAGTREQEGFLPEGYLDSNETLRNVKFTVYRLAIGADERRQERVNPSYPESSNVSYKLSDIRIWVEDSGDYNTSTLGNVDSSFDETLNINIPGSALPVQMLTVSVDANRNVLKYESNEKTVNALPLRVVYTVGMKDELLTDDGLDVDLTKVSAEYIFEHKNPKTHEVEFFSNFYSGESYDEDNQRDTSFGNAAITFSPSEKNRFYVFQKNLVLYKNAEGLDPETGEGILGVDQGNGEGKLLNPVTDLDEIDHDTTYYIAVEYYYPFDSDDMPEEAEDGTLTYDGGYYVQRIVPRTGSEFHDSLTDHHEYLTYYNTKTGEEVSAPGDDVYVATKVGAKRLGRIARYSSLKESDEITNTANYYYAPKYNDVSQSFTNFLGNNGALKIDDQALSITKTVENKEDYKLNSSEKFEFNVHIDGKKGDYSAVVLKYNPDANRWDRQISKMLVHTDNEGYLLAADKTRAKITVGDNKFYFYVGNSEEARTATTDIDTDDGATTFSIRGTLYTLGGDSVTSGYTLKVYRLYRGEPTTDYYVESTYETIPLVFDESGNSNSFYLRHNEGILINNLRNGQKYTVTEKLTPEQKSFGYTLKEIECYNENGSISSSSPDVAQVFTFDLDNLTMSGTTTNSEDRTVNFINTCNLEGLTVTKQLAISDGVTLSSEDLDTLFTFKVTLTGDGLSTAYYKSDNDENRGEFTMNEDGTATATIQIKGNQSFNIYGLHVGNQYTIEEVDIPAQFALTSPTEPITGTIENQRDEAGVLTYPTFNVTNTKKPMLPVNVSLEATKKMSDGTLPDEGAYTFVLIPVPSNPDNDPIKGTIEVTNDADGLIKFFEDAEFTTTGRYVYMVMEKTNAIPGIILDDTVYSVTYDITESYTAEDPDGHLVATRSISPVISTDDIEFINTIDPNYVTIILQGNKTLERKDLSESDTFSFKLEAVSGEITESADNEISATPETSETSPSVVEIGSSEASSSEISSDETEDSTEASTSEVASDETSSTETSSDETEESGNSVVNIDPEALSSEEDTGTTSSTTEVDSSEVSENSQDILTARILGKEDIPMPEGAKDGELIVTNDLSGAFTFGSILYTHEGTYVYEVSEINGGNDLIDYDDTVYTVTVTVTRNDDGMLEASVAITDGTGEEADGLDFNNVYVGRPDVEIHKAQTVVVNGEEGEHTTDKLTVKANDTVRYFLTVKNTGDGVAENVVITDEVPEGLILTSMSDGGQNAEGVVTWNIGNLEPNAEKTVYFDVKVPVVKELTTWKNTATVNYDNPPETPDPSETVEIEAGTPDLTIHKTQAVVDGDAVSAPTTNKLHVKTGDTVRYFLTVTNNGSATAHNVVVTDKVPEGLTFVSAANDGSKSEGTITWNIGDMAVGASVTVSFDVTVPTVKEATTWENVAAVVSDETPETPSEEVEIETGVPALSIHKSQAIVTGGTASTPVTSKLHVESGNVVRYFLTVTNNGSEIAHNVVIKDTIPDGLEFVSASNGGMKVNGAVEWRIDEILVGDAVNVSFDVKVPAVTETTSWDNMATVTSDETPEEPSNEVKIETGTPSLNIRKTQGVVGVDDTVTTPTTNKTYVNSGDTVRYFVTVTNNGTSIDHNVVITDKVPEGLEFVKAYNNGTENDGTVTWNIGDMAVGASVTVSFDVKVPTVQEATTWKNVAAVVSDETPETPSNEVKIETGTPSLNVHKTQAIVAEGTVDTPTTSKLHVESGNIVRYFLTVTNNGTSIDHNVVVTDKVPAGLEFVEAYDGGVEENGTITWTLGDIAVGASVTVTFDVKVPVVGESTAWTNVATVMSDETPDTPSNEVEVETGVPALSIHKTQAMVTDNTAGVPVTSKLHVEAGNVVRYFLTVTNDGKSIDHNVVVIDKVPEGLEFVKAYNDGVEKDGTITWVIGDMAVGASVTVSFDVKVPAVKESTTWKNVATVVSDETPETPSEEVEVETGTPALNITKTQGIVGADEAVTAPTTDKTHVKAGDIVRYFLTVTNSGTSIDHNVVITDKVPEGLEFVEAHNNGVEKDGTITWTIGDMAVGASVTVSFDVKVPTVKEATTWKNVATVVSDETPETPSNEVEVETATPNLTIHKSQALVNGELVSAPVTDKMHVESGNIVRYFLTVTNNGAETAHNVVIRDTIPEGLEFVSASEKGMKVNGAVEWHIDELAVGDTVTVSFDVKVPTVQQDTTWKNIASVVSDETPNTPSNEVEVEIGVPALDLQKTQAIVKGSSTTEPVKDKMHVEADDVVRYFLTVTNNGDETAHNVVITDRVPSGLEFVSAANNGVEKDGMITWNIADLRVGESVTVSFDVRVPLVDKSTTWENMAYVSSDETPEEPSDKVVIETEPVEIGIHKAQAVVTDGKAGEPTTEKLNVESGNTVRYFLTVTNRSASTAHNVVVTDKVPEGLTFVSASNAAKYKDGVVTWELGDIPAGDSITVTFDVKVPIVASSTSWTNVATLTNKENPDPIPSEEVVIETVPISIELHKAQAIVKDGTAGTPTTDKLTVNANDTVRYYLTVTNTSTANAHDVVITDKVPDGLTLLSVANGGINTNGTITWTIPTIAPGESVTVTFDVKVPAITSTTTWKNQATASHRDNESPVPSETVEITETPPVTPPTPQTPDKVQTGDVLRNNAFIFLGIAVLFLIAGVGIYGYNKKKKKDSKN